MDDIKNDPRFAHILSDPKFRPMPKKKRKVKIDSRFQSLFTNKHFSHRTDIDKRGRPVLDPAKKNKHVMKRFYELSSEEDDESGDEESDSEKHLTLKKSKTKKNAAASPAKRRQSLSDDEVEPPRNKKSKYQAEVPSAPAKKQIKSKDKNVIGHSQKVKAVKKASLEEDSDGSDASFDALTAPMEDEGTSSSDDHNDDEDEDDTALPEFTQDHIIDETDIDHKWNELHKEAPVVSESTRRLALCNMDWDFVKAQDLFILFKSFVPESGRVKSVTIYPSEFGKERMAEEAQLGPKEIRQVNGDREVEEDDGKKKKKKKDKDQLKTKRAEKEKEAVQTEKLREYQLNRLRYYYAVVDCDSVRTADAIYNECDGREYMLSSVRLDLRFIPDDMTFDDDPKDQFSENQSIIDYQPSQFCSTALSQAKVDVTWDETDFDRLNKRMSGLQQKELENVVEENKYADIIAPPESDSDEDGDGRPEWLKTVLDNEEDGKDKEVTEEEKIQMYRKLLMDKITEEEEEKRKEEEEFDKEIEWQPGLKSSVEKKLKKKETMKNDSVLVSEYLEKKKEKKKRKKEEKLNKKKKAEDESDGEQAFSDDDIPDDFDMADMKEMVEGEADLDHIVKSKKDKKKKKKKKGGVEDAVEEEIDERDKAELELMFMDGGEDKSVAKPEAVETSGSKRKRKKKEKKLAKLKKLEQDKEDFALDVDDPRFTALYTSHHFHIDPNAPQFKKTKNMVKLVDEQIKRKNKKKKTTVKAETVTASAEPETKSMSQSLVESLKRKMKK